MVSCTIDRSRITLDPAPDSTPTDSSTLLIEINLSPATKELRVFSGLLIPFAFFVGFLLGHYEWGKALSWWIGISFGVCGIVGLLRPAWVRWVYVVWIVSTFPVGWLISHLILVLVFYGMFFPIGLVAKCFGYDPLQLKNKQPASYWHDLKPVNHKDQYFRQF